MDSTILQLWNAGCIRFGSFKLSSGGTSNIYVNLRNAISDPFLLRMLARCVYNVTVRDSYDVVCGVPYGAVPA